MGKGCNMVIYNMTPHDFKLTGEPSNQMNHWQLPDLPALTRTGFYYEYSGSIFDSIGSDWGNGFYDLTGTAQKIKFVAGATTIQNGQYGTTNNYYLEYSSDWGAGSEPMTPPYYMFSSLGDNNGFWRLLNKDTHMIGKADQTPDFWLKIVQIDHYCQSEGQTMQVLGDLISGNTNSTAFQAFVNKINLQFGC